MCKIDGVTHRTQMVLNKLTSQKVFPCTDLKINTFICYFYLTKMFDYYFSHTCHMFIFEFVFFLVVDPPPPPHLWLDEILQKHLEGISSNSATIGNGLLGKKCVTVLTFYIQEFKDLLHCDVIIICKFWQLLMNHLISEHLVTSYNF